MASLVHEVHEPGMCHDFSLVWVHVHTCPCAGVSCLPAAEEREGPRNLLTVCSARPLLPSPQPLPQGSQLVLSLPPLSPHGAAFAEEVQEGRFAPDPSPRTGA